jgi:tetratricopeptide (TPR) repeat protein
VNDIPLRTILGLNQQTYQRLKVSLSLNLRRQIFVAVCDDLPLRNHIAAQLQVDLAKYHPTSALQTETAEIQSYPRLASLYLNLNNPDPIVQMAQWLTQFPPPKTTGRSLAAPAFQILGVEQLTRQPAALQRLFFTHLQSIERNLPLLESSVLIWITQPWLRAIPDSAPDFWRCRTGIFEFIGDPTPLPATPPEWLGMQSSAYAAQANVTEAADNSTDSSIQILSDEPQETLHSSLIEELVQLHESDNRDTQNIAPANASGINPIPELEEPGNKKNDSFAEDLPESLTEFGNDSKTNLENASDSPIRELDDAIAQYPYENSEQSHHVDDHQDKTQSSAKQPSQQRPLPPLKSTAPKKAVVRARLASRQVALSSDSIRQSRRSTDALETPTAKRVDRDPVPLTTIKHPPATQPSDPPALPGEPIAADAVTIAAIPAEENWQALPLLQQIQLLQQQQAAPDVLATAYRTLGNLYRDRIEQGDASPQNLAIAIQAYGQALHWLPESSSAWIDALNDVGNLYWMLSRFPFEPDESQSYLQQAIQSYQSALTKLTPETHPQVYPMVQNNLGAAYADLARYQNPAQNLQLSVNAYGQALQYRQPDTDPQRYASTQNNLGTTYWNLAQYREPESNLKRAIVSYSEALRYYKPEQDSLNYAMIQNNLGTAYWNLAQYEQSQDWLVRALTAYRNALKYRTLDAAPMAFAATHNNLGTAYWHMANYAETPEERLTYLQQAINSYEAALDAAEKLVSQSSDPSQAIAVNFDLFATHNNLGLAHYQVATDLHSGLDTSAQSAHLEAALKHHVQALQGWEQKPDLRQTALNCLTQTTRAFYNQLGIPGQSLALSLVPGHLLPEILPKL